MKQRFAINLFTCVALLLAFVGVSYADTTVLKAAWMLDVTTGAIVRDARIVVEDGKIVAINPRDLPRDATVIDLGDRTLLPGLMDAHVHLTMENAGFRDLIVSESAASSALRGAQSARKTLMGGFTTVRDLAQVVASPELVNVAIAQAIDAGHIVGPDVIACGHALSITGGHIDPGMFSSAAEGKIEMEPEHGIADGPDEVLRATRYQIKHGAKVIKISATAGVMSLEKSVGAQQYSDEEMRVIVEEADRHGIPVAAHAHGLEGIKAAIRAGVASIEHGSILDDESIALFKEHGTFLVPTSALTAHIPMDALPPLVRKKAETVLPMAIESHKRAIAAGVKVAIGSDSPLVPHGENAKEISRMVELGMSPADAIRAATVNTAELFGLEDRGRLEVGLRADIVAVPGNPLESIESLERVDFVMKAGKVYRQP